MFDLKKIDSVFASEESLKREDSEIKISVHEKKIRFIKLILPAIAAALIGLLMVFPHLKSSQKSISFDVTMPKKGELEKLHIESTKFYVTDADNQISQLTADNIDETKPSSKVIKLSNPHANVPLKNDAFADIMSSSGYFDQSNNRIMMTEDVFVNYNNETSLSTKNFNFDFKTSTGEGKSDVVAAGVYGTMKSKGFQVDNKNNIFNLLGKTDIKICHQPDDVIINSSKIVTLYKNEKKIVIEGDAKVMTDGNTLFADEITIFYKDGERQPEIESLSAKSNVKLVSEKGTVHASRAEYSPKNGHIELFDNVVIEQDGNKIFGDYATTDLNTGLSKIVSKNNNSRVRGTFKKLKTTEIRSR